MTGLQTTGGGPGGYGPGGGGPPGGGYGPPPGGGFGGPPPGGGGFGGPPGGGGFGGPPPPGGGGYNGPPPGGGGYGGPPPGGYGGPPMPPSPPQKKGPNVGLIVGLGCLGLAVLGGIGVAALAFIGYRRAATAAAITRPSTVTTPTRTGTPSGGLGTSSGTLKAELRDLREAKADFGKARYFVGELYNTGDTPLSAVTARVTLLDASNTAVDSGSCYSVVLSLPPGEKVPCSFAAFKGATYATTKIDITPMRAYTTKALADLKVENIKFTLKKGYSPHQLDGKITNLSSFKAKSVWALVSLYGADGKIVGAEQTLVAGSDLDAGQSGLFSAKISNVAGTPQTYNVKPVGYGE